MKIGNNLFTIFLIGGLLFAGGIYLRADLAAAIIFYGVYICFAAGIVSLAN